MNTTYQYDYIIAGGGCAGLSLVMHMISFEKLRDKKILIVDKSQKNKNDRTWCFWERENGLFENVVYKQWKELNFYSSQFSKSLSIDPYTYKLIRGIDFYNHCLQKLSAYPNVTILNGEIENIFSEEETGVQLNGKKYTAQYVFNSTLIKPQLKEKEYWLLQHFKGWFIKTSEATFNAASATLMDFRTDQKEGTTFFYVLPFSPTEALIEYTLFSHELLDDVRYEKALKEYIKNTLSIDDYQVVEKEFGVIPMTNFQFPSHKNNIINIGTAGGQTKGSSGYTFKFIQKHSEEIVKCLNENMHPGNIKSTNKRFHFYDSVLLNILYKKTLPGDKIFSRLFEKNKASNVFRFLDNESSLKEELSIISTLPTLPFTKAAMQQLF